MRAPTTGFSGDILADDEHVVLHRRPHWKRLVRPFLALALCTAAAVYATSLFDQTGMDAHTRKIVTLAVWGIWLIAVSKLTLLPYLAWRATHLILTDRRVLHREGILTRSGIDIPLDHINSVEFTHGLLDQLLGTGTLIVESASPDPVEFDDIPNVEYVHSLLYRELTER